MNKEKLDIKFEAIVDESFKHSEFTKVKIWIATYGKNRNKSNITKEAFEKAIPSLYNVPILGEWSESVEDFKGHGGKIEITDEEIKFIETTKAYGVIPESCNARWELTEEGEEYLVCDGYIWTGRYAEASKVMDNTCNQSMEINALNVFEEDDHMVIDNFVFTGICILGEKTEPCFKSAKVVYSLDKEEYKKEFDFMLQEINKELNTDENFALSDRDISLKIEEKLSENRETITDRWGDEYDYQKYWLVDTIHSENIAICEVSRDWYKHVGIPYSIDNDSVQLDYDNAKRYIRGDWREYQEGDLDLTSKVITSEFEKAAEKINSIKNEFDSVNSELEKTKEEIKDLKSTNVDYSEKVTTLENENKTLYEFKEAIEKEQKDQELNKLFAKYQSLKDIPGYSDIYERRYELDEKNIEKELKVLAFDNNISLTKNEKFNYNNEPIKIPILNRNSNSIGNGDWDVIGKYINK